MSRLTPLILALLLLTACGRTPTAESAPRALTTASTAGVTATLTLDGPSHTDDPTLADTLTATLALTRPGDIAPQWPDPASAFPGFTLLAEHTLPPRAVGPSITESRLYTLAPYLPGEHTLGPITLTLMPASAPTAPITLTLPAATITVASPTPPGQSPQRAELRDAPPPHPPTALPAPIWWIAAACTLLAPLSVLLLRRTHPDQPSPATIAARCEAHLRLLTESPPNEHTLTEVDRTLRAALAALTGKPKALTLRELAPTERFRALADTLDAARFVPGRSAHTPTFAQEAAETLATHRLAPKGSLPS